MHYFNTTSFNSAFWTDSMLYSFWQPTCGGGCRTQHHTTASRLPLHAPDNLLCLQVVNLHHFQVPLAGCIAACHGPNIVVYSTELTPGELPRAKGAWKAHNSQITALATGRTSATPQLFSADQQGTVNM